MIERYEKKEISTIWSDNEKFNYYLKVECALLKALGKEGVVEPDLYKLFEDAKIDPKRISEIERETRHDVIAFCTSITEQFESEKSRFFHFGVTSSDIIDTATNLQIKDSLSYILKAFKTLNSTIKSKAVEFQDQLCIGRSHGIYAEPMSFGQKLLGHYCEFERRYNELSQFYENELTGQISGAVGNYTILTPDLELNILKELGLKVEPVSTQVIPRDRIAKLISIFSLFGCALERIAIEIRHLQHSDIKEAFEGFKSGQKGSSTMPHKKNPISSENLTGMARVLRSHMSLAMDNCLLWHERDISHSSAERMFLPDSLGIMLYSIERLNSTIEDLVVDKDNMSKKINDNYTHLSSYILHDLIKLSKNSREDIYKIVQNASFQASNKNELFDLIYNSLDEQHIKDHLNQLKNKAQGEIYANHTKSIFDRVNKLD